VARTTRCFETFCGSLAGFIRYSRARWAPLDCLTTDGRLEMTNNAAERAIRPLALGRKNWLFAGSDNGERRAATIYTITQTPNSTATIPKPISPTSWPASPITPSTGSTSCCHGGGAQWAKRRRQTKRPRESPGAYGDGSRAD
jgi:hypothetical protein